jgi:cytochrome c biogenesis protein CcdA
VDNPISQLVFGGNLAVALPIALLAGIIAFASPCVLPLVPGYLAYIGGFAGPAERNVRGARQRGRLLAGVSLFVLGFSVVFIALNLVAAAAGTLLIPWLGLITRIAGVLLIVMGLVFIGQFRFLQRDVKPQWRTTTGLAGAPLLGIVFGLGWAPCIGPTLAAVPERRQRQSVARSAARRRLLHRPRHPVPAGGPRAQLGDRIRRLAQAPHPSHQHHRRVVAHSYWNPHGLRTLADHRREAAGGDRRV